jgi:DNA-binding NtrC family response regulator
MAGRINTPPGEPSSARLRAEVLLVMDQALARKSLADWLKRSGCRALEAADAEEAMELLTDSVDVVLLDMRRKGAKALDLLRRIKERSPLTEVMLLVGRDQIHLSIEGMREGAFDDMTTPLNVVHFLDRVRAAWEHRRSYPAGCERVTRSGPYAAFLSRVGLRGQPVYSGHKFLS